jgi:predicted RNA-binding Zn-ribbon protein involved in translation (DUF1610 family)
VKSDELNEEEIKQVAGGRFNFSVEYDMAVRAANIKCPACGAEGTLRSQLQGYKGYADGTRIAVDSCICTSCGSQVNLYPELNQMGLVKIHEDGDFDEQMFPYTWH